MSADTKNLRAPDRAVFLVFAGLVANAATAFAIQAWMTYGFGAHVWHIPIPLCVALIVALDLFAVLFMILTYALRGTGWPRVIVTATFLFAVGSQVFAAELFGAYEGWATAVRWFSALPAVILALAQEGVILWRTRGAPVRASQPVSEPAAKAPVPVPPTADPAPGFEIRPRSRNRRTNGPGTSRQALAAKRVIDQRESAAAVAADMNCSIRSVQLWVKAERERRDNGHDGGTATVYLIGDPDRHGPVKVGVTNHSVQMRLGLLKQEKHDRVPPGVDRARLAVLDSIPGTYVTESAIHDRLSDQRVMGEWFDLGQDSATRVAQFRQAAAEAPAPVPVA